MLYVINIISLIISVIYIDVLFWKLQLMIFLSDKD
jgi:hypothetical protein